MESSAKNTMYAIARNTMLEHYAHYVDNNSGANDFLFCVVSQVPLSATAKNALANSAQALGYSATGCFFVTLSPVQTTPVLEPKQLFSLLEGIDPLVLVVADASAMHAIEQAYRLSHSAAHQEKEGTARKQRSCTLAPYTYTRVLGRDTVSFSSFEDLLQTPQLKQKAWALLKKLPKCP